MPGAAAYQAPQYAPGLDAVWYHVLYGHVPGHQLDFIYRPELPHQKLKRQHFSDLQLVIRHLQPTACHSPAFAICNLSAYDTQHVPGHGGLGLVASMRLQEMRDHAGRAAPILAHAALIVDAALTWEYLNHASQKFLSRFCRFGPDWYCSYYELNQPLEIGSQARFLSYFAELPRVPDGSVPVRWRSARSRPNFRQLLIECPEDCSSETICTTASRLAAVLYHSALRWLAISDGQDLAIPGLYNDNENSAILIRFVYGAVNAVPAAGAQVMTIDCIPADEDGLAALFGLTRVTPTPPQNQDPPVPAARSGDNPVEPSLLPAQMPSPEPAEPLTQPADFADKAPKHAQELSPEPETAPLVDTAPVAAPPVAAALVDAEPVGEDASDLIVQVVAAPPRAPKACAQYETPATAAPVDREDLSSFQTELISAVKRPQASAPSDQPHEEIVQASPSPSKFGYRLAVVIFTGLAVVAWTITIFQSYRLDPKVVLALLQPNQTKTQNPPPRTNERFVLPPLAKPVEIPRQIEPRKPVGGADGGDPSYDGGPSNSSMALAQLSPRDPPSNETTQLLVAAGDKPPAAGQNKRASGKRSSGLASIPQKKRNHTEEVLRYNKILSRCQQFHCIDGFSENDTCKTVKELKRRNMPDFEKNPNNDPFELISSWCSEFIND